MAFTKDELNQMKTVVSLVLVSVLSEQEEKYEKKLEEFKSEFFEKIDPILTEVTTARDERVLIENRVEKLEKLHPQSSHQMVS